jgi:hypothetical protein
MITLLPETRLIELPFNKNRLFIKCENELPFGGGNKVRRLLCWLDENINAREIHLASDYGSHSFLVLSNILRHKNYNHLSATFWERENNTFISYREKIRKNYLNNKLVDIKNFDYNFYMNYILKKNKAVLFSLAGKVFTKTSSYAQAMSECISQLKQKGIINSPVWHLLPLASGMMADEFSRYLHAEAKTNHNIIGLLTGDPLLRLPLKMKYYYSRIHVVNTRPISQDQYDILMNAFFQLSNMILDPLHTIYLWKYLEKIPAMIKNDAVIVMWLTHPTSITPATQT